MPVNGPLSFFNKGTRIRVQCQRDTVFGRMILGMVIGLEYHPLLTWSIWLNKTMETDFTTAGIRIGAGRSGGSSYISDEN